LKERKVKAKNMKLGMSVVIKDCASDDASEFSGQVGVIKGIWIDVSSGALIQMHDGQHVECHVHEIRKAPPSST
jgi:hypothetical protein